MTTSMWRKCATFVCTSVMITASVGWPGCSIQPSGGGGGEAGGGGDTGDAGGGFTITGKTFTIPLDAIGPLDLSANGDPARAGVAVDMFTQTPTDSPSSATLFIESQDVQVTTAQASQTHSVTITAYVGAPNVLNPCEEGENIGSFTGSYDGAGISFSVSELSLPATALSYARTGEFTLCLSASGNIDATLEIGELGVYFGPSTAPGPDEPDGDDDASTTVIFTEHTHPADPVMFQVTTSEGENLEYYAEKDEDGYPTKVTAMRYQTAEQVGTEDATWIHFGDDQLPNRFIGADGSMIDLEWVSDTEVLVTGVTGDGAFQINTLIDLDEPLEENGGDNEAAKMFAGNGLEPSGTSPRDGIPLRLEMHEYPPAADPGMCLETDVIEIDPKDVVRFAATGTVRVQVLRCDSSVDNATVYVAYDSPWAGGLHQTYPAYSTGSPGVYSASLPQPEQAVDPQKVEDLCRSFKAKLDTLCTMSPFVAAVSGTWLCVKISAAIDLVAAGPTGEGIPIFAVCETAVGAYLVMCAAIGTGPVDAPPGTPGIGDLVCDNIKSIVDHATKPDPTNMEIEAYAQVPGQGKKSTGPQIVLSTGPYPDMTIDFGASPSIDSFTTSPADPGPGEAYTAEVKLSCATGATVTIAVSGTDGYSNSVSADVPEYQYTATLYVPGGGEGVRDTISVLVIPSLLAGPDAPSLSMTIAVVF